MMLTKDKIMEIVEEHADTISFADINAVAEAIAKLTTKAHAAALFTGPKPEHANAFLVPLVGGGTTMVIINPTEQECQGSVWVQDSDDDDYIVEAIKLWKARQEAK